ncbi:hypothetical protein TD95_005385 [Thielaviopsis punctulata]|uniref:Zn(2)-C6 fungal-type domain-containing protein n=1 Tax=Thielaviopsis punctulata TaxID=72032 RepID=A0A0F4Z9Z2_9PEZI|nr:hypothetical protein TD95_005385 [Thielaviopsis punctulata]
MDPRAAFQMPPHMVAPQLVNPPPRIFGSFGPDGLQVQQFPPELAVGMFGDPTLLDDSNDPKRRRIARACDMCRKKKIKCDGKLPACSHCLNYKTDCVFTQVEKKRSPPKGAKYIEGLENRLGRMESLLRLSGLLDDDDGATDLGALEKKLTEQQNKQKQASQSVPAPSNPTSPGQLGSTSVGAPEGSNAVTPQSSVASPESVKPSNTASINTDSRKPTSPPEAGPDKHEEVEELSEMMCSLVTNQSGETRYIGSSSGFSIFSPKGIQWVNEKMGDNSFQRMISDVSIDDHKWTTWKPEVFGDLFPRPIFRPLPSKPEAMSLFKDYFENFNCMFPLFHQPTFMHLVERHYSGDPYQGSGWWASINVVLAIANRLRVMSNLVSADYDTIAWDYLKNAMGVFSELVMRNADLLSVQALLGMALFMQGTPNPQPSTLLIATAIRLSHSIGLHKKGTGFNLNPIEIEQRKRVFWIAYMLDKDLSLRSGRPPAQDDDDMNVELPDADPEDNIGNIPLADGKGKMNLFRVMCEFACIEGKVYKRLYATKATKQSDGEYLNVIGELDKELEDWKDRIPIDFRPEHEIKASHTPLILHVVMLHFSYYNCLTTIHRMSIHHGYWTSRLSNYAIQGLNSRPINPRIFSSAALCTAAARASISLIKYVPQGDNSCVWMILYFPVSALVTLFGNILQNPLDPRAKADTKLISMVVSFLSMLGHEAETGGVHRMLGVCSEFERIARVVIENAEKEHGSRRKRKSHDVNATSKPAVPNINTAQGPQRPSTSSSGNAQPQQQQQQQHYVHQQQQYHHQHQQQQQLQQQHTQSMRPQTANSSVASQAQPHSQMPAQSLTPEMAYSQQPQSNMIDALSPMSAGWPQDFPIDFQTTINQINNAMSPRMVMSGFQQPLLPQDLYSLPVSLDWDWAEMSGGAYPTVENGNFGMHPRQRHGHGGM